MPVETGASLPSSYFAGDFTWWITSIPPYYCQQPSPGGNSLNADTVYCGVSVWPELNSPIEVYSTGLKYAYTYVPEGEPPAPPPKFLASVAGGTPTWATSWQPLNKPAGPYSPEWDRPQSGEYKVGLYGVGLFFVPYDLNKTTNNLSYPVNEGDVIFIATGSDVLGGNNEGQPYSANDNRVFNLLFYSTGSDNAFELGRSLGGSNAYFPDYSIASRYGFVKDTKIYGFVALPNAENPSQVIWWPIMWNSTTNYYVNSINAS